MYEKRSSTIFLVLPKIFTSLMKTKRKISENHSAKHRRFIEYLTSQVKALYPSFHAASSTDGKSSVIQQNKNLRALNFHEAEAVHKPNIDWKVGGGWEQWSDVLCKNEGKSLLIYLHWRTTKQTYRIVCYSQ